jgi:hypothetical protein
VLHVDFADFGWPTLSDRKPLEAHMASGRPEDRPHITPDLLERGLKTVHWSSNPSRSALLRTTFYNEYVHPSHLDDAIFAHQLVGPGLMRWLLVNRAAGDAPFSERECRLMSLLNLELARLLGSRLAHVGGATVTDLPPRQRDVLVCLMNGDNGPPDGGHEGNGGRGDEPLTFA